MREAVTFLPKPDNVYTFEDLGGVQPPNTPQYVQTGMVWVEGRLCAVFSNGNYHSTQVIPMPEVAAPLDTAVRTDVHDMGHTALELVNA